MNLAIGQGLKLTAGPANTMEGRVVNRAMNDYFVDGDAPRASVVQYCR